ncbi:thymidine kinase [Mycoplasmopsis gallopavonis]|uniref:Thymidine kinase n=1 Tax=Mycoplasmopsis gallopavonis TaxID=76629 RepID=A0A449B0A1_9BACT|nr:thymidine kinase [Mycoplasmopsis gallopavonis]RIV16713.1 thymidine kinase [Mycoplasmopsis gallopavonis]VEU73179.1 thymidine kinase [Mycoplasmopsis gallopavonis]
MFYKYPKGSLEVITGPMFAGKSAELIKRIKIWKIAGVETTVFKPQFDTRFSEQDIVSRTGSKVQAISIQNPQEVWNFIDKNTQAVAFDEVHFFKIEICQEIIKMLHKGIRVVVSGLDMDFEGKSFDTTAELLALCDHALKLKAVCMSCKGQANMSYRKVNSKERHLLGDSEYEARCRICHKKKL